MKKRTKILIVIVVLGCILGALSPGDKESQSNHDGEVQTPSGSEVMKGKNYTEVQKIFEKEGFTNIQLEEIDDLITGWLVEDGDVEEVSVGGDVDYSPDQWVPADTEVIIRYHTYAEETEKTEDNKEESPESTNDDKNSSEEDEILTVANCSDLSSVLSNKADIDDSYTEFSEKYKGRVIQFDGRVDYMVKHGDYNTRFDILVSAGDYDPDHQVGPSFKFEDVNANNLGISTLFLEDELKVGQNVKITAEVGEFKRESGLFFLDPVKVEHR